MTPTYPDPALIAYDSRFDRYIIGNAGLELLWTGGRWLEGPVWFGDGRFLLFSDIPNNRILRWDEENGAVNVYRQPSEYANGHTRDMQGRLISCEHRARRVTRTEYGGAITVLADRFDGKRLNAPNDVTVKSDGSIWFTDPGYGILVDYEGGRAEFELPTAVYRVDASNLEIARVCDDLERPNGLCFNTDESVLYIADSGAPKHIKAYDVVADVQLEKGRVFAELAPALADGIRMDEDGNVWAAVGWGGKDANGVYCIAEDGDVLGRISLPEPASNLCFGGLNKNHLFITASRSLYAVYVNTRGIQHP